MEKWQDGRVVKAEHLSHLLLVGKLLSRKRREFEPRSCQMLLNFFSRSHVIDSATGRKPIYMF